MGRRKRLGGSLGYGRRDYRNAINGTVYTKQDSFLCGNLLLHGLTLPKRDYTILNRAYEVNAKLFHDFHDHIGVLRQLLSNTAVMWGVACVLPHLFGQMESRFVLPVGFAILSLNTPLCILLSCDPALERAVRFLPGQKKAFCIPYCLFLFICNMTVDTIFLCSWQIQIGGVTEIAVFAAVLFALLSASGSVLLEWYCPIRGWKIESDLLHHPRKYVVPGIMLLLAGLVSIFN